VKESASRQQRDYELACLEAVRRAFAESASYTQHRIGDIRLEGEPPASRIVVEWEDGWSGAGRSDAWPLWDHLFGGAVRGPAPPEFVASVIWANVAES
jgi:hypothetical protein